MDKSLFYISLLNSNIKIDKTSINLYFELCNNYNYLKYNYKLTNDLLITKLDFTIEGDMFNAMTCRVKNQNKIIRKKENINEICTITFNDLKKNEIDINLIIDTIINYEYNKIVFKNCEFDDELAKKLFFKVLLNQNNISSIIILNSQSSLTEQTIDFFDTYHKYFLYINIGIELSNKYIKDIIYNQGPINIVLKYKLNDGWERQIKNLGKILFLE